MFLVSTTLPCILGKDSFFHSASSCPGKEKKIEALKNDWLIDPGAYPGFCSMKRLGVFLVPLNGMLVRCRSLPRNLLGFPNNLPVPIYTSGWRDVL